MSMHRLKVIIFTCLLALVFPLYGYAVENRDFSNFGLPRDAEIVPDVTLENLRGRFMSRGKLIYFGVEMLTQWRTADGRVITAGLEIGTNLHRHKKHGSRDHSKSRRHRPTITFRPVVNITNYDASHHQGGSDHENGNSVSGDGLDNVTGVTQSIRVAGNSNHIRNDINMIITEGNEPHDEDHDHGSYRIPTRHLSDDDGVTVTAGRLGDALGIDITIPGQGSVQQLIRASQGLGQHAQIVGWSNEIHNVINIRAQLDQYQSESRQYRIPDLSRYY